jgi:hypothetical protein
MSYREAEQAAKRTRRKRREPSQAYRCQHCRGWHYGQRHV